MELRRRFAITLTTRQIMATDPADDIEVDCPDAHDWSLTKERLADRDATVIRGDFPYDCELGRRVEDRLMEVATS